jgi:5-methyltetrahydrofolate corrinoid/iron sulfur protein methyltransferase
MKLIGENIHIISKKTREAIESRDTAYIQNYATRQTNAGVEWIDLNIGPARRGWEGVMEWLIESVEEVTDTALSLDTTNYKEMEIGLKKVKTPQKSIINSASGDESRLNNLVKLASEYQSYLIALTLSDATGIPKEADGRLEIACTILEAAASAGVDNGKILLDPLVLPVNVDQSQVMEALNAIRIFKESFDPPVLTTIGLSNISNGCPKENRALINRVFAVMAMGCGLDTAIADAFDVELVRVNKVIETSSPEKESDPSLINIHSMMQEFGDLEDIAYNKANPEEVAIYKTAEILLNKNIYSHNYLDI